MPNVHVRPHGANAPDPSHPPLDLGDHAAVRAWLSFAREHALDVIALGQDAAKPPSLRTFSRHEIRRRLADEERVLLALLDAAARGLPPVK
jgi:hypothetical protein